MPLPQVAPSSSGGMTSGGLAVAVGMVDVGAAVEGTTVLVSTDVVVVADCAPYWEVGVAERCTTLNINATAVIVIRTVRASNAHVWSVWI
jgi:hypothetical protein